MIRNIELTLEAHATRKYIVRARIISMGGRSVDAIAKGDSLESAQQSAIEAAKERLAGEFGAEAMPTPASDPSPQKEPPLQREAPTDPLASTKGPAKVWGDQALIINGHEIPPQPWALEVCDEVDNDCNGQADDVIDNDCDGQVDDAAIEQSAATTPAPSSEPTPATQETTTATEPSPLKICDSMDNTWGEARVILMNAVARRDELNLTDLKRITKQIHGTTSSRDLSAEIMRDLATQIRNGPTNQDKQVAGMQREFLRDAGPTANPDEIRAVAETPWAVVLIEEVIVEWQHKQSQRGAA